MKILLIHGLSRTPVSLWSLEWQLRQAGWATEQFGYAAFFESYAQIVQRLQSRLEMLSNQGEYSIVAHSLGGVLTRSALSKWTREQPQQVVMLGTPNQMPRLARLAWQFPPFQWWTRDCGENLASHQFYAQLPPLDCPYRIIAGTGGWQSPWSPFGEEVNDGIVAVSETKLSETDQPLELPVNHTLMMNVPQVQETVVRCLTQK